ncbi:DUF2092 domain-containing protein [Echinicola sp. CAU 1574]|uniref:DUF2092 domain-containing protein n=1 Tax=Echinicola arenosa TaxID=2774144 RepID=A0ABR9AJN8_9BACT|nr:DUF2092 domain-containing protein [Echinicola arenosa]MBD8489029.1 DUF2092 domain-containing protein [Echinicola arenosa]
MKRILLFLVFTIPSVSSFAQEQEEDIDPIAVFILDHMASVIGDLESCHYTITTEIDTPSVEVGTEKEHNDSEVYMQGPNKMLVHSKGQYGHRGFYYNGEVFTYYSYSENNYTTVKAPDNILSTIDSMNYYYDVEFPAADFFYPTFTDDLLENFDKLKFLGSKLIDGKDCFHIAASNDSLIVQIWIANDATNLPVKLLIIHKDKENFPQYEATFTHWEINPVIPASIFEFSPPPGARLIAILPKH